MQCTYVQTTTAAATTTAIGKGPLSDVHAWFLWLSLLKRQ